MFCSYRTGLIGFFVVLAGLCTGLIVTSVLYTTADEAKYATNCTVTQIGNACYLVRPISGNFTFPYVYNQTPEYVGDKKSCKLENQLVSCYIYKGEKGGDPENGVPGTPFTGLTTDESKARASDYSVLLGLTITFAVVIVFYLIIACVMTMSGRRGGKSGYSEL